MRDETSNLSGWERQRPALAGFAGGLLLTVPGIFPVLAPVQVLAFVPLLVASRRMTGWRQCFHAGLGLGLAFIGPQVLVLQLPPAISLILIAYFMVLLMLLVIVSWRWVCPTSILGCFAFGALLAVLDWVTVVALPMWGSAQSFARCWSAYPGAIAFVSVTGMPGIMFVLGVLQALVVLLLLDKRRQRAGAVSLVAMLAILAIVDAAVLALKPVGHLKVAAVGWVFDREHGDPGHAEGFARLYAEPVAEAVKQGARLVVSPEAAFAIYDSSQHDSFEQFRELAHRYDVYLAVGYLDVRGGANRMAFIGPAEGVMERYAKVHMTPFENSPKGDGEPTIVSVDGVSVGAMICHDDNYTDISRRYGDRATAILAVPTNDWTQVRHAHFQSMIHRAIESRFAVVRAASNGISAIISPEGKVRASRDHFRDGPGFVIADIPVYNTRTIFCRYGHWFVVVCALLLVALLICRKRHGRVGWASAHADSSDGDGQHGLKPILQMSNDAEETT